jgi:hypothetical protein
MNELIDEFKEGQVVFIRWNPDGYTPAPGFMKKSRPERLQGLLQQIRRVLAAPPPEPVSVFYMYYSARNPVITETLPYELVS